MNSRHSSVYHRHIVNTVNDIRYSHSLPGRTESIDVSRHSRPQRLEPCHLVSKSKKKAKRQKKELLWTWRRPKDKPLRPLSAYNIFFKHERQKLVAQQMASGNGSSLGNMARYVSDQWKLLSEEGKQRYETLATEERNNYRIAVDEWLKKNPKENKRRQSATSVRSSQSDSSTDDRKVVTGITAVDIPRLDAFAEDLDFWFNEHTEKQDHSMESNSNDVGIDNDNKTSIDNNASGPMDSLARTNETSGVFSNSHRPYSAHNVLYSPMQRQQISYDVHSRNYNDDCFDQLSDDDNYHSDNNHNHNKCDIIEDSKKPASGTRDKKF
jgi:HMG (high mobility group) box